MLFYLKALKISKQLNKTGAIINCYNNIGNVYVELGKYDKALNYANKALKAEQQTNDNQLIANSYELIGLIYSNKFDYEKALKYFNESLIRRKASSDSLGIMFSYHNIGNVYYNNDIYDKAMEYLNNSLELAKTLGHKESIANNYSVLSELYYKTNNCAKAYEYLKLFMKYNVPANSENDSIINELASRYETENKEQENKLLKKQVEVKTERIKRNQIMLYSLIAGVLMIVIIAFLWLNNYKKRNELTKLTQSNLQVQINALKSKVDPSFLFNTFDVLMYIIEEDSKFAAEYLQHLSNVYRYILNSTNKGIKNLKEEIKFINSYYLLLSKRFGEKFKINITIDELMYEYSIPIYTIHSLLENAMKQNIMSTKNPLIIDIFTEGEQLIIKHNIDKKDSEETETKDLIESIIKTYSEYTSRDVGVTIRENEFIISIPLLKKI